MVDEYSDETFSAWTRFAAAVEDHAKDVKRRSRDWMFGVPPKPLTSEQQTRLRQLSLLQSMGSATFNGQLMQQASARPVTHTFLPRQQPAPLLGGLFGNLI